MECGILALVDWRVLTIYKTTEGKVKRTGSSRGSYLGGLRRGAIRRRQVKVHPPRLRRRFAHAQRPPCSSRSRNSNRGSLHLRKSNLQVTLTVQRCIVHHHQPGRLLPPSRDARKLVQVTFSCHAGRISSKPPAAAAERRCPRPREQTPVERGKLLRDLLRPAAARAAPEASHSVPPAAPHGTAPCRAPSPIIVAAAANARPATEAAAPPAVHHGSR